MGLLETIKQRLTQDLIVWHKSSTQSPYPDLTYETGVAVKGRWEASGIVNVDVSGDEFNSKARVYFAEDVVQKNDFVYLVKEGDDVDALKALQPQEVNGSSRVIRKDMTWALDGGWTLYTIYLSETGN